MTRKATLTLISAFLFLLPLLAPVLAEEVTTYTEPVLISPAGQSAEGFMVRTMCTKGGINATLMTLADADSLDGFKTLIFVAGGSSKGLGAAKVDDQTEKARIKSLIAAAKKKKIRIITFHLGGEARRGALSDDFNKLAAEAAEIIVVKADGDTDGFFSGIANDKGVTYKSIKTPAEALPLLKGWFGK